MRGVFIKTELLSKSLIFSLLIFISSCNFFNKPSSHITSIEGKIDPSFTKEKKIYFYQYTDSMSLFFCQKVATDSCEMNADGSFILNITNFSNPGFFDIGTKEVVFARNYFLQPGDNIKLFFEGKEMPIKLSNYDDIGKYNTFLQIFNDTFYREPITKRNYFVISNYMIAPEYAVYIGKRRDKQFEFYENYFKGKEIDSTFKYYFEHETNYNWANDKVYFLWKKRIRQEEVPVDTNYFDFLKIINTDDAKSLICPAYTRFVDLFLKELYQEEIFYLPKGMPQSLEKCFLAKKHLKGIGRKIAYYNILRDEMSGVNLYIDDRDNQHQKFIDSLANIAYTATSDSCFFKYVKSFPN